MERQTATKVQKTSTQSHSVQRQPAAPSSAGNRFIELQRSIGNEAAQRLINGPFIQAKLSVSSPGDPLEEEADQVADSVMRMPVTSGPFKNAPPVIQRKCDLCEGDECAKCGGGQQTLQRKSLSALDGPLEENDRKGDEEPLTNQPPPAPRAVETSPPPITAGETSPIPADASAGNESSPVVNVPAVSFIVPFDRSPLAAPGERIIFSAMFTDPTPGDYQLEYSTTGGGHFNSAAGPTTRTIAGLVATNVDFFMPNPWLGTPAVQVVMKLRKISNNSLVRTETWNFGLKKRFPTTMTQRETTGERAMPAIYTYDIGPPLMVMLPPFYEHQTILERFGTWSIPNIAPADINGAYRTQHSLNSTAAITNHFLGPTNTGLNGTFTVDANDRIADQHGGTHDVSKLVANLVAPKDIEVALPQTYEARPGTTLGSYTVTRVRKANGTWVVKKG